MYLFAKNILQGRTSKPDEETDVFESLEYPPNLKSPLCLNDAGGSSVSLHRPLSEERFLTFFDPDGRLIDEHSLRRAIFNGGVDPQIRKEVWQFIFELFPFLSTKRERDFMLVDYHLKYYELKRLWQEKLTRENVPDVEDADILEPPYLSQIAATNNDNLLKRMEMTLDEQQLESLKIQAKVYSGRHTLDLKSLLTHIRIIVKDVPRTDRELDFFSGANNPHLRMLHDLLITYAALNMNLGYTQGMNDIAARFLIVTDNEVEAFWCFSHFMKHIQNDFVEDGLLNKLKFVQQLLAELDPDLYGYLQYLDVIDLTFCHRWMLLNFKREFSLSDGLRCFEILCSHHLELSSLEARRARERQKRKDFEYQEGTNQLEEPFMNSDFTFDVFMCATILIMKRSALFKCKDSSDVFQLICGLNEKMDLDTILQQSENIFFKYCSKSVVDCFQLLG